MNFGQEKLKEIDEEKNVLLANIRKEILFRQAVSKYNYGNVLVKIFRRLNAAANRYKEVPNAVNKSASNIMSEYLKSERSCWHNFLFGHGLTPCYWRLCIQESDVKIKGTATNCEGFEIP